MKSTTSTLLASPPKTVRSSFKSRLKLAPNTFSVPLIAPSTLACSILPSRMVWQFVTLVPRTRNLPIIRTICLLRYDFLFTSKFLIIFKGRQYRSLRCRNQRRSQQSVRRFGWVVNWRRFQPRSRWPRGQVWRWWRVRLWCGWSVDWFRRSWLGKWTDFALKVV